MILKIQYSMLDHNGSGDPDRASVTKGGEERGSKAHLSRTLKLGKSNPRRAQRDDPLEAFRRGARARIDRALARNGAERPHLCRRVYHVCARQGREAQAPWRTRTSMAGGRAPMPS
jgi:hypothetical protein